MSDHAIMNGFKFIYISECTLTVVKVTPWFDTPLDT